MRDLERADLLRRLQLDPSDVELRLADRMMCASLIAVRPGGIYALPDGLHTGGSDDAP